MVKVDLITGFLGAGKTTFLIKYARYLMKKGLRIGILEYDYGAINTDMLLLNKLRGDKCELEMVAAACDEDCLKRRFTTKLISMAMTGYDRIIVEPSGIFDMDMFYDALRDDPLENLCEIGSVISIVNARLRDDLSLEEDYVLASMAACSGIVILSRTQESSDNQIQSVKDHLSRASEAIKCRSFKPVFLEKNWDEMTDEDFLGIERAGYKIGDYVKVTAGGNTTFTSVCFPDVKDNFDSIIDKIKILLEDSSYGNVIRVKGFAISSGGSRQINASKYEITTDPVSIGQGVLIVIGTELCEERIRALING